MRNKVLVLLAIILVSLIGLSGCIDIFGDECEVDGDCSDGVCIDGRCKAFSYRAKGLDLRFVSGNPPDEIVHDEFFTIMLELTNRGSYTVPKGEASVEFSGGTYDVRGEEWISDKPLKGITTIHEDFGSTEFITYEDVETGVKPIEGEPLSMTINANLKYNYETRGMATICIPAKTDEDPFCTEAGNKLNKVSSAPVTITSVEEDIYSESIDIRINVKDEGSGDAYLLGSSCSDRTDEDYIGFKSFYLGGKDYSDKCHIGARLSAGDETDTIVCKGIDRNVGSTTERVANMTLEYCYSEDISTDVDVVAS